MDGYEYTLIKSNRKTIAIKITEENCVVVRAPLRATVKDVERLLCEKRSWIERVMAFNRANCLSSQDIKEYREAYVGGAIVPVYMGTRNYIDGKGVHVTGVRGFRTAYVSSLGGQFLERFKTIESACGLKASAVSFRAYRSMWGCCDSNCNVTFNFKLLMLPQTLQDYVIVHELCHTVFHDHSGSFWALVSHYIPYWKLLRRQLRNYAFLVKLY